MPRSARKSAREVQVSRSRLLQPEGDPPAPDLDRLAGLVVRGEIPFPTDLSQDEIRRLAVLVQQRRRQHLIRFIARAIARDLHRKRGQPETRSRGV